MEIETRAAVVTGLEPIQRQRTFVPANHTANKILKNYLGTYHSLH
jgi:hypothetical protein